MLRRSLAAIKNCAPLRRAFSLEDPTYDALQTQHDAGLGATKWIVAEPPNPAARSSNESAGADVLTTLASTNTRRRRRRC